MTEDEYKKELLDMFDFVGNKLQALLLYSRGCKRYDCARYIREVWDMLETKRQVFKERYCERPDTASRITKDHTGKP